MSATLPPGPLEDPPAPGPGPRRALRDTLVMAATSNINIIANVARVKIFALAFGTSGVGLLGILQAVMGTATMVAGLGMDGMAVRELASARSERRAAAISELRAALTRGSLLLGLMGALLVLVGAPWIARFVELPAAVNLIRFSAIGVGAGIVAMNLRALINGYELINALARASVFAALLTFAFTASAVLLSEANATAVATVAAPVALLIAHLAYLKRVPPQGVGTSVALIPAMARLSRAGAIFTIAGLLPFAVQIGSRALIQRTQGLDAVGLYQACWTLSATYVGVLLSSASASLLPRLSALRGQTDELNATVNEQARIYLTLFAPVYAAMLILAPLLLRLLYSSEFSAAAELLRWQLLGDIFKLPVWTLATSVAAARMGRSFFLIEALWVGTYLVLLAIALQFGTWSLIGASFAVAYAVQFGALTLLAWRALHFRWDAGVLRSMVLYGASGLAALALPDATWKWFAVGLLAALAAADAVRNGRNLLRNRPGDGAGNG